MRHLGKTKRTCIGCLVGLTFLILGPTSAMAQNTSTQQIIIDTMRSLNLQTAEELLEAVDTLSNVGADAEAKKYLQQLVKTKLSGGDNHAELVRLYKKLGASFFIRLGSNKALAPLGQAVANEAMSAARSYAISPERIAALIADALDDNPDIRSVALSGLREAGVHAAPPLVQALAGEDNQQNRQRLENALVALGEDAVQPLLGALKSPLPFMRGHVAAALGRLRNQDAILHVLRHAVGPEGDTQAQTMARSAIHSYMGEPSVGDATLLLSQRVQDMLHGERLVRSSLSDDELVVWRWSGEHNSVLPVRLPVDTANALIALDLASDLHILAPENDEYEQLYLAAVLTAAKLTVGIDEPLDFAGARMFAELLRVDPSKIERTLQYALRTNLIPTAIAAAETMGHIGTVEILNGYQGQPRPLARALRHRNRRIRFAAAQAIMQIAPTGPFAGAADTQDFMVHLIGTHGSSRALVVHTRNDEANRLAGLLRDAGYEADIVETGREALKQVAAMPDYELVFISDAVSRWSEWVQQLRRDVHSGALPIGIVARGLAIGRAENFALHDDLTIAYPMPQGRPNMTALVSELAQLKEPLPATLRIKHAVAALGWMEQIAASHSGVFDLLDHQPALFDALTQPELATAAARVLGYMGTPRAQTALANYASQSTGSQRSRQFAARALDLAIGQRGVQLTASHILEQYDRYNTSQALDPMSQEILGSILDAIERGAFPSGLH